MTTTNRTEAKIDISLANYLEKRALEIALSRAAPGAERTAIERLAALRAELMTQRAAHHERIVARRHARGDFYSDAKVKSINALGPSRNELDMTVDDHYAKQDGAKGVLQAHGLASFAYRLVSERSNLGLMTPDIADDAGGMLALEEAFANEWAATIADPAYNAQLAQRRREAAKLFRTSNSPMWLVAQPACPSQKGMDAEAVGRAWSKLESISGEVGLASLSNYVGIDGQAAEDGAPATEVLAAVEGLLAAIDTPGKKLPAKKATLAVLEEVRAILQWAVQHQARVYFDVEF